jgi:serine/threonine protein kinase
VFASGQLILARYALAAPIGQGAMAGVWQAEDLILKRQVAIKLLAIDAAEERQSAIARFLREARITAAIQHRNVIHISDFGVAEDNQPFMVMELLEGETLHQRLSRPPTLPEQVTLHIVSLVLRGLAAVHEAGIIHRDLKPENIFLPSAAGGAFPKLIDFGVAMNADPSSDLESVIEIRDGLIVGTPGYMSPEQARGQADLDIRSDLYSVGVLLYEALAGKSPHDASGLQGDDLHAIVRRVESIEPPPLRELAPSIHPLLSDFVARAMARDREQRFPSARSMRAELLATAHAVWPEPALKAGSLPPRFGRALDSLPPPPGADVEIDSGLLNSSMPAEAYEAPGEELVTSVGVGTAVDSPRAARSMRWLIWPSTFLVCAGLLWLWKSPLVPSGPLGSTPSSMAPVVIRANPPPAAPALPDGPPPPLDPSLWDPTYLADEDAGCDPATAADPSDQGSDGVCGRTL